MSLDGENSTRAMGRGPRPSPELAASSIVGGWRVVRHLATGGFGSVYEVVHVGSGVRGALKVLHPHMLASPEMVARLVRESSVIARLRHANIVELLAAGSDEEGKPYLVMEYLEGHDLSHAIRERGRFTPAEVLTLVEPLCGAVALAHEHGVVHRDIKASNVFICGDTIDARVVLLDFGIAKLIDHAGADLTASRQALGTPASMAPEQIRGTDVDGRADVYALGALVYHLLTGRMPFEDASMTMSQYLHLHAARPRPSASAPIDARLDDVVVKAMAVDPARRHGDALAFFAALRNAVSDSAAAPVAAERDTFAVRVRASQSGDVYDDALLDDLDAVLPAAEAVLSARGFTFARDLGDAALFFAGDLDERAALAAVTAVGEALAARAGRDARVKVAIWLHRGQARIVDGRLDDGPLSDPASWGLPEEDEGIWITGAIGGERRARRLG